MAVATSSITATLTAQEDTTRQRIVGDAILSNRGYELLQDMTTQFQGRLAGTAGNAKSMDYLEAHLQELGIRTHRERFDVPGWRRGTDRVTVTSSMNRPLRAAALGYVAAHSPVQGPHCAGSTQSPLYSQRIRTPGRRIRHGWRSAHQPR